MQSIIFQGLLWLLAGTFAASALTKIAPRGRAAFRQSIADLVSPSVTGLAPLVPAAEVAAAVLLAIPATAVLGTAFSSALLLAFTILLVRAALNGIEAPCHCFGALSRDAAVGAREVVRNMLLLATLLVSLVLQGDHMSTNTSQWLALAITFALAAAALVAVVALAVNLRRLGIPVGEKGHGPGGSHGTGDEELFPVGSRLAVPNVERGEADLVLGVLSTTCPICVVAAGSLHQTAERMGAAFVALVDDTHPGSEDLGVELDRLGASRVMLSEHPELTPVSEIRPGYAVIDREGRVARSGTGHTELALELTSHD